MNSPLLKVKVQVPLFSVASCCALGRSAFGSRSTTIRHTPSITVWSPAAVTGAVSASDGALLSAPSAAHGVIAGDAGTPAASSVIRSIAFLVNGSAFSSS